MAYKTQLVAGSYIGPVEISHSIAITCYRAKMGPLMVDSIIRELVAVSKGQLTLKRAAFKLHLRNAQRFNLKSDRGIRSEDVWGAFYYLAYAVQCHRRWGHIV